ncbi:ATP-binding protein [Saccharolobus islandicus]|uniref:Putative ATPase n=1 Tax=Saccharolobus islandicus LAL14/1 TaxID=1241935 RepID=M9UFZ3_SACIS|nr:ATP-binding protein [Sulfolobus islandicus]AGJ63155.1 putative ATPase [Sulfolobus islandicus LAL14/1]
MNKNLWVPILLIVLGIGILFHNLININLVFFMVPIIIMIIISFIFRNSLKLHINKYILKNGIFQIVYDNTCVCGVAMKITGKIEPTSNKNDIEKELKDFINAIARKDSEFKFTIFTIVEKNKVGSSIIIYKILENSADTGLDSFMEEVNNLLVLAKAIAPHLEFKVVQPSKNVLPIPMTFGNYPFLTVSEITYTNPINSNNIVSEDFDVEIGEATNGTVTSKVGIRVKDITRHIGIFGSTGSGKTNTAILLASQLHTKGVKVIILDWHGEYAQFLKNDFRVYDEETIVKINPLHLIDLDVEDTVDIIGDVLQLTDPQRFLLYTILLKLKSYRKFSINQLLEVINNIEDTSYWMRDVKYALLRKIFILFIPTASKLFSTIDEISLNEFPDYLMTSTIINLGFISNLKLRKLYSLFLIKLIVESYIRYKITQQTLVILDEAQNYFNKEGNEFIDRLASEIRKYNIGLCFITQSPSLLSQNVLKNTNIKIIHSIKSDIDKKAIRDTLSLDERLTQSLDKLDVGEAVISAPNLKVPIIIKIKKMS